LLNVFDGLVICDIDIPELQKSGKIPDEDAYLFKNCSQPEFWNNMTKQKRKTEFDKFAKLLSELSDTKSVVRQILSVKIDLITKSPFSTFEDYVTHHQMQITKSPFFATKSPHFQCPEFEADAEDDIISSHVDKGGHGNGGDGKTSLEEENKESVHSPTEVVRMNLLVYVEKVREEKAIMGKSKGYCDNFNSLNNHLKRYNGNVCVSQVDKVYIDGFVEFLSTAKKARTDEPLTERYIKCLLDRLEGVLATTVVKSWRK